MERPEIPITHYPNVSATGAKPGDIICGIGYNQQDWLGLHLVVVDSIAPGTEELTGMVRITKFGNLLCDHEPFRDKLFQKINLSDLNFQTKNFTKIENIWPVTQRFEPGEKAVVIKAGNSHYREGQIVTVHRIFKYPDQRVVEEAHYKIYIPGDEIKTKLDSGMERSHI